MAKFCKHCGAALEEGAQFCPSCGSKVEAEAPKKFCSGCGAELAPGARFCKKCGTAADGGASAPQKRYCAVCGAELKEGARFCNACGASADSAAPAQPVRPAAQAGPTVVVSAGSAAARAGYTHQEVQTTFASERAQAAEPIRASQRGKKGTEKKKKGYGFLRFLLLLACAGLIYIGVTKGLPNIRTAQVRIGDPAAFVIPDQEHPTVTEPESAFVAPAEPGTNPDHPTLYFGGSAPADEGGN